MTKTACPRFRLSCFPHGRSAKRTPASTPEERNMDARQLKLLGARVRELLAEWDVAISHGQALDLVAALPGLRDWPEVIAFSDRVAACDIDLDATSRLGRRIGAKFGQRLAPRV